MSSDPTDVQRRALLQMTAGLATAGAAALNPAAAATAAVAARPAATGKPGDFDFLTGQWKIKHRQRKGSDWDLFEGEATVFGILAGVASVEELRIPTRNFSGMGLRLLDPEQKLWADHWVNRNSGVLTPPPSWGSFVDGVGLWDSDDMDGDQPIIVRGAWDRITPASCRWYQASSRDGGRSWQESWIMNWARA